MEATAPLFYPSFSLMGAEDESYFNQVWVQRGQTSLMGAEWCVDYVKGSLITDQTVSLPGRVRADRGFTRPGRGRAHARFCFPWTLSVCKKRFSASAWPTIEGSAFGQVPDHLWQSSDLSSQLVWTFPLKALIWNSYWGHFASVLNELWPCQNSSSPH